MGVPEPDPVDPARGSSVNAPIALLARGVTVDYRVASEASLGLRHLLTSGFSGSRRSVVHAVRDVSLTIREGESVGIVGSNGSGKSTLLRSLAGLVPPTQGEVYANCAPQLLGVGQALRPALSGHRNIEVGLLALGVRVDQIPELAAEIADFTDIGDALDRPLRTYSSGMRARLQFSISTSVRPRILMIDEALAVGDRNFKAKSYERMDGLRKGTGTIILVSHSAAEVQRVCDRAVWLKDGVVIADGPSADVLAEYGKS